MVMEYDDPALREKLAPLVENVPALLPARQAAHGLMELLLLASTTKASDYTTHTHAIGQAHCYTAWLRAESFGHIATGMWREYADYVDNVTQE
jgi:hypothetical protein